MKRRTATWARAAAIGAGLLGQPLIPALTPAMAQGSASSPSAAGDPSANPPVEVRVMEVAADAVQPRDEADLKRDCISRSASGVVTFVREGRGKVLLASFTDRALADPRKDVLLAPRLFTGRRRARPTATEDWGYVHDRNGDGRVDQIAFLVGPQVVEPDTPDPALPKAGEGQFHIQTAEQMQAVLRHMQFVFWQVIDTDFDGRPDVVAFPARRKDTGWYRGWALVDAPDPAAGACRMIAGDGTPAGSCAVAAEGRNIDGAAADAYRWILQPGMVFTAMRDAAAACKLGAADLRP